MPNLESASVATTSTAVQLTPEQRELLAKALQIDVKYVPDKLGVLGVPRAQGPRTGIPVDRVGQFAPAMLVM
jgi:hypothetical protein